MIFRKLSLLLIGATLWLAHSANAGCSISMSDGIKKPTETYSFCKNTFSSPRYQVSWYSSIEENDFVMLFNFDPRKTSINCKDFEINGKSKSSCNVLRKSLLGKPKIPYTYKNKNSKVHMVNLDHKGQSEDIRESIKNKEFIYQSSDTIEDLTETDCFAGINVDDKVVYLGYKTSNLTSLGYCIQGMESWLSKNFKSIKSML